LDLAIADFDEAIRLAKRTLAHMVEPGRYDVRAVIAATLWVAFAARGRAYFAKGDPDRALADFDEAIRREPHDRHARQCRGRAYFARRNYDLAIADYDEVIRRQPTSGPLAKYGAETFVLRGLAYAETGRYDLAVADYDAAIKIDPGAALAFDLRAAAIARKSEPNEGADAPQS
jgi:tetratricopeptide (TPR) repeat protein